MLSQGNVSVGPLGLELGPWMLASGSVIVKGVGFATVSFSGVNFSCTFSVAQPDTNYVVLVYADGGASVSLGLSKSTTGFSGQWYAGGGTVNVGSAHIAVFR